MASDIYVCVQFVATRLLVCTAKCADKKTAERAVKASQNFYGDAVVISCKTIESIEAAIKRGWRVETQTRLHI